MRAGYRKGLVLGLTLAEVFILLVFLLLLVALALSSRWSEENTRLREQVAVLTGAGDGEPFVQPEDIQVLVDRAEAAEQARDEEQRRREEAEQALDEARTQAEAVKETLADEEKRREEAKRALDEARKQAVDATETLAEEQKLREDAERARNTARMQADTATQAQGEAERNLDVLRRKGENPPCWYDNVPARGGTRERAHYILNVAVFDSHLVMAPIPPPPGSAADDVARDGARPPSYAEEARRLGVADLPFGRRLTDSEFVEAVQPIFDAGKQSRVRTYSCVFSVRVWDRTSPGAKARWKRAHDRVLEGLFGTYSVRSLQWPGA